MRQTWWSRRAIGLHVVILIVVPTFAGLCVWQVRRALSGNQLSWAYAFEWPFFAGYAIYMWWRFLHEAPREVQGHWTHDAPIRTDRPVGSSPPPCREAADATDDPDPEAAERAAYNEYLSELAVRGRRKQWR